MIVKPFRAIRYSKNLKDLVAPPYDAINSDLKSQLKSKNPYNVVRLILPEGENRYENASTLFHEWLEKGILIHDEKRSIYPYQSFYKINGTVRSMRGILALFKLSEFKKGVIMPHEKTFSAPKADRLNLMKACGANFSPVLGLYKSSSTAKVDFDYIAKNSVLLDEFESDDKTEHRFYGLQNSVIIERIIDILRNYPIIIGDGHHRYETALNYKMLMEEQGAIYDGHNWILMFLVDMADENISLLSINRKIKGVNLEELIPSMKRFFDIYPPENFADDPEAILISGKKGSYSATAKPEAMQLLDNMGISEVEKKVPTVVADKIIAEFLLKDKDTKIRYYGDDKKVMLEDNSVLIKLHPVKYEVIEDMVNNNYTMPQKSTFFYPKIPTGLVINKLDQDV